MKKKLFLIFTCLLLIGVQAAPALTYAENDFDVDAAVPTQSTEVKGTFDVIASYLEIEKTPEGLEQYKSKVNENIDMLEDGELDGIYATITFNSAVSFEDMEELVDEYDLDVKMVEARSVVSGERFTTMIQCDGSLDGVEEEIEKSQSELTDGTFSGYIDMCVAIDSDNLKDASEDENIFLVDTSGDAAVCQGATIQDGEERNKELFNDDVAQFPQALSWDLEDISNQ